MGSLKNRNRDNETREQLAKLAGVSHTAYDKGHKILSSDNGD